MMVNCTSQYLGKFSMSQKEERSTTVGEIPLSMAVAECNEVQ